MPIFEPTRTTSLEEERTFDQVASPPVQAPAHSALAPIIAPVPNVPAISSIGKHITATNINNFHALQSTFETQHDIYIDLQDRMRSPIVFLSEINGDIMYFHQAIKKEDGAEFIEAVVKEMNVHVENKY